MKLTLFLCLMGLSLAAGDADGKRWWSHIVYLADDKLEGRDTGSEGHHKAARYVAQEFERAGLKPAGTSGYMQTVPFRSQRIVEEKSSLEIVRDGMATPIRLGEEANFNVRNDLAPVVEAPAIFTGFGITVPESNFDELAGLDLKGKIAVFLTGGPTTIPSALLAHYQSAAERWGNLKRAGAIGMASISNPKTADVPWARATLARFMPSMRIADPGMSDSSGTQFSIVINPERSDKFFAATTHTMGEILELANANKPLPKFPLNASLRAHATVETASVESENVVGVLNGSDPKLKDEYVVVTAHLDHVGIGRPIRGDAIYNGAMDNASGIATILETALVLKEQGAKLKRSILFAAVTGEEKGLQGSRYLASHPVVGNGRVVADLNFDMFLPLHPLEVMTVYGYDESTLGPEFKAAADRFGVRIQPDPEPLRNVFIRSDQYSFIRQGIPSLTAKFGYTKGSPQELLHKEWLRTRYHAPSDDINQPVDIPAAAKFNRIVLAFVEAVANDAERPRWNESSFFRRFEK